jgi:hypothetical protein
MSAPHEEKLQSVFDTPARSFTGHTTNEREILHEDIFPNNHPPPASPSSLHLKPSYTNGSGKYGSSVVSSGRARSESHIHEDNIELMRAEIIATKTSERSHGDLLYRSGSRKEAIERSETPIDELDDRTNPVHNSRKRAWHPPTEPTTSTAKLFKRVRFLEKRLVGYWAQNADLAHRSTNLRYSFGISHILCRWH